MNQSGILSKDEHRKQLRRRKWRDLRSALLLLAPYICLLIMFGVVPVIYAFGLSFVDTLEMTFYGVENYAFVFSDYRVPAALVNVVTYCGAWLTISLLVVITLSLMLDVLSRRAQMVFRGVYFLPGAVTTSAIVVLWLLVLDPAVSPYQTLMRLLGWETREQAIHIFTFVGVFVIMAIFSHVGGWIVVLSGSLSGLSTEMLEAARVDGANRLQTALRIKLPLIRRSLILMAVLNFAVGLQVFAEPQLMNLAGPHLSQSDWSLNQLGYQYAFSMGDFGASAALSTLMVAFCALIALTVIFATNFYRVE